VNLTEKLAVGVSVAVGVPLAVAAVITANPHHSLSHHDKPKAPVVIVHPAPLYTHRPVAPKEISA
jgi:hypothetical protein